jgi:hypothetical protein
MHTKETFATETLFTAKAQALVRMYTILVVEIPKVPKTRFDAVLGALLKSPPMPMAGIIRKAKAKTEAKKRG